MAKDTKEVSITFEKEMLEEIDKLAKESKRSRSNMVVWLIWQALQKDKTE